VVQRKRVYDIFSSLNKLRFHPWYKDVFIANNIIIDRSLGGAFKFLRVRSALDSSSIVVIGNFDVTAQTALVTFPVAGTWYDYLNSGTFTATASPQSITLQPGEYRVYLNRNLINAVVTSTGGVSAGNNLLVASVYPNPVSPVSVLEIDVPETGKVEVMLLNAIGEQLAVIFSDKLVKGKHRIPLTGKLVNLHGGLYLLNIKTAGHTGIVKLAIQ
jgi:hypothetical protein